MAVIAMAAGQAGACVCAAYPSVKQAWEKSPVVFVGYVENAKPNPVSLQSYIPEQTVTARVEEPFKGCRKGQTFVLAQPGHDCAPKFRQGDRVLLYVNGPSGANTWEAFGCGRTRSFTTAADDLLFLRALPGSATHNRLAGEVAIYENSVAVGFRRARVLSGIHVHLRSENHSAEAVTNDDGVYQLSDLPPDNYRVVIDIPRGLRIYFPIIAGGEGRRDRFKDLETTEPNVQLGLSSTADVDFVLVVDNQISGHVLDSTGKPVKDVCVQLEPAAGEASHYFYISKCSEVDGGYRLKDMPSGQYRIRAEPWAGGKRLGTRFFYPGTTERKDAAVVTIGDGEHLDGFDIRVPK